MKKAILENRDCQLTEIMLISVNDYSIIFEIRAKRREEMEANRRI